MTIKEEKQKETKLNEKEKRTVKYVMERLTCVINFIKKNKVKRIHSQFKD